MSNPPSVAAAARNAAAQSVGPSGQAPGLKRNAQSAFEGMAFSIPLQYSDEQNILLPLDHVQAFDSVYLHV